MCLQLGLECGLDINAMIVSAVSIVRKGDDTVDNVCKYFLIIRKFLNFDVF